MRVKLGDISMQRETFARALAQEGFSNLVTVTREPGALEEHAHPFEAKALILAGEIHIRIGNDERLYRVGDVFQLPPDVWHSERYGPQGVQYLVGRK
jgi:quercetin dioxygenase-like cupin family protein